MQLKRSCLWIAALLACTGLSLGCDGTAMGDSQGGSDTQVFLFIGGEFAGQAQTAERVGEDVFKIQIAHGLDARLYEWVKAGEGSPLASLKVVVMDENHEMLWSRELQNAILTAIETRGVGKSASSILLTVSGDVANPSLVDGAPYGVALRKLETLRELAVAHELLDQEAKCATIREAIQAHLPKQSGIENIADLLSDREYRRLLVEYLQKGCTAE